ncbi:hypothetical protein [Caballeronia humi]|uniref:Uncharacterized protein n=1 Tax=Caballeronia humi TaxID=326474 RepID=A0A158JB29_9BURK|nr:hypothetical protein [Caballeronia humi]SAL66084.1 hypothetical protein AWB65_06288 [Caballeronia humi]
MIRTYLIDPFTKAVTEVERIASGRGSESLNEIYHLLHCQKVKAVAMPSVGTDAILVVEEGLHKVDQEFFRCMFWPQKCSVAERCGLEQHLRVLTPVLGHRSTMYAPRSCLNCRDFIAVLKPRELHKMGPLTQARFKMGTQMPFDGLGDLSIRLHKFGE